MIRLFSGCKVNLGLRVLKRRPDGYHELDSLFWPLTAPRDELRISQASAPGIRVRCADKNIDPAHNTLTKAYDAHADATGEAPDIEIELIKRIPLGAGLGGGSGNAAALLIWLNSISRKPLPEAELARLALLVGADVPFFLKPRPSRVLGIGEKMRPVRTGWPRLFLVLACPSLHVDTGEAFALLDEARARSACRALSSARNGLTKSAGTDNGFFRPGAASLDLRNDLEVAVFSRHPFLAGLKAKIRGLGALASGMTGSGSGMFGLFESADRAKAAAARLRDLCPRVYCQALTNAGM